MRDDPIRMFMIAAQVVLAGGPHARTDQIEKARRAYQDVKPGLTGEVSTIADRALSIAWELFETQRGMREAQDLLLAAIRCAARSRAARATEHPETDPRYWWQDR